MEEFKIYVAILFKNLKSDCDMFEILDSVEYALTIDEFIKSIIKYHDIENYKISDFKFGKQIDYNDDRILIMDNENFFRYLRDKAESN